MRRAQVSLSGAGVHQQTSTDASGRYRFFDLPPGRFRLEAEKTGYRSTSYAESDQRPDGQDVVLTEGQSFEADIALRRGATLSGRVTDEFGDPVAAAAVRLFLVGAVWNRLVLYDGRFTASTDDRGEFRLYALPPGQFVLTASASSERASRAEGPTPPLDPLTPTYYPAVSSLADASMIALRAGEERSGITVQLGSVRRSTLRGLVLGPDGQPREDVMVSLGGPDPTVGEGSDRAAVTDSDGRFTIEDVLPGSYDLSAEVRERFTHDRMPPCMTVGEKPPPKLSAVRQVVVPAGDTVDLNIELTYGFSISGQVRFGDARPPSLFQIVAIAAGPATPDQRGGCTAVGSDGRFTITGVGPGTRLLHALNLPAGYVLQSVLQNGRDVTDAGFEVSTGNVSGLELVVNNRATEIVASAAVAGEPVKSFMLIVFAEDPDKWALPETRWVSATPADDDGLARLKEMPPGAYFAAAVEDVSYANWSTPEMLTGLKTRAQRIVLTEGEKKAVSLSVIR